MESSTVADRGQVKWSVKWNKHLKQHLTPLFLDHIMAWYFHTLTLKFVSLFQRNFFMRVLYRLIKYFLGFYKWKLNFLVIIFLWPCLVVRKRQDTKIRKTDKKTNKTIKKTKPKFVSVFFVFLLFKPLYYLLIFFPSILYLTRT